MKPARLSLIAAAIASTLVSNALALDLYMDEKTKQLYAEPGHGRIKLGSFQRVEDAATQKAENEAQKAEIAKIKDDLSLKNNELKALEEHVNDPTQGKLQVSDKGIKFESKDGNFDMKLTGRLQVDSQINLDQQGVAGAAPGQTTNNLADGVNIRRARLGVEGTYYKEYGYKFEYDFARGNGLSGGITDAFLSWKGIDNLTVTLGQWKEYFSMEEATSNRFLTFIERNMAVNAFTDNNNPYKVGLGLQYWQPRWMASGGFQTESVGNGSPTFDSSSSNTNWNVNRNNGAGDIGWGPTGRVTALPWFEEKNKFWHVGVSGSQRYPDNNFLSNGNTATNGGGMRFASALGANVDRTLVLDTGFLTSSARTAHAITRFGGETALVYGPFSAQGEYIQADISGKGYGYERLDGAYGYVTYFLTGESRTYKPETATWDRIKPNQNFSSRGGIGAWEFALGYDTLNLDNKIIQGGRASSGKIGLNWYPNSRVRLMANFVHFWNINTGSVNNAASTSSTFTGCTTLCASDARSHAFNGTNPDIFELRGQIDF
jgi:phosphate-selective porin OprO and OprP